MPATDQPAGGVVVALRPSGSKIDDAHTWLDAQRAAGADAVLVVAVNGDAGRVELREFGAPVHGSVLATVALIVQARAIHEFKPALADPPDEG